MASNGKGLPLAEWQAVEDAAKAFEQAIAPHWEILANAMDAMQARVRTDASATEWVENTRAGLRSLLALTHWNLAIEREWIPENEDSQP